MKITKNTIHGSTFTTMLVIIAIGYLAIWIVVPLCQEFKTCNPIIKTATNIINPPPHK